MSARWVAALALLAACNGDKDDDTGETDAPVDTDTDVDPAACTSDLVFTDANNYSYSAQLALDSITVGAEQDATVDWSAMTTDFRGRPMVPADVTRVTMARIGLDHDATIAAINSNSLTQSDIGNYVAYLPTAGETSAPLTAFEVSELGIPFNPADPPTTGLNEAPDASYLMTLWKTNVLGNFEIVMSAFVVPVNGDANHQISLTNDSATLSFDIDLATPICAAANASPYSLDWSAITNDANGKPYSVTAGDLLRITHLPQEDVADVEGVFLRLDVEATETYYGYITLGAGANPFGYRELDDLGEAMAADGTPFPGFTTDGTWLVDIECASLECFSPAPLILAVVEVEGE